MYKIELGRKAVLKVDRFMVTLAAFRNVSFDIKIIAFEIKHDAETVNTVSNTGSQIKKINGNFSLFLSNQILSLKFFWKWGP